MLPFLLDSPALTSSHTNQTAPAGGQKASRGEPLDRYAVKIGPALAFSIGSGRCAAVSESPHEIVKSKIS